MISRQIITGRVSTNCCIWTSSPVLYNRNNLSAIVRRTTDDVFIPITVGGGLRSVDDVREHSSDGGGQGGHQYRAPSRTRASITQVAEAFGSQCMVLGIEAKKRRDGPGYEAYYDNGREHSGKDVIEWARRGVALGAGEILLTSVDKEGFGTGHGPARSIRELCAAVSVPVIVSGGCRRPGGRRSRGTGGRVRRGRSQYPPLQENNSAGSSRPAFGNTAIEVR